MPNPFFHGVGGVLRLDNFVPGHKRKLDFYSMVFSTGSTPHCQASDFAASVARALELGGQEFMHGNGDDQPSHWAVDLTHNARLHLTSGPFTWLAKQPARLAGFAGPGCR